MDQDQQPPFENVLGETSELRMLEKLLAMPGFEFSITELASTTGMSRLSVHRAVKKLGEWRLIDFLPRGKRTRYQLNKESSIVQALYDFNHALIGELIGESMDATSGVTALQLSPQVQVEYMKSVAWAKIEGERVMVEGTSPPKLAQKVAIA